MLPFLSVSLRFGQSEAENACNHFASLGKTVIYAVEFAVESYGKSEYAIGRKGLNEMPNIKPISDLRNYSEVLHDVAADAPRCSRHRHL